MLTIPLAPTDDLANPLFKDAASCAQWLKQLQLTNLQLAHSLLLTQINELTRFPMRGLERLNTLEILRDTVHHVQNDYARKLLAKPLPLNETELVAFLSIIQLWHAIALGYQRCLQTWQAGDKQLVEHGALLCQRCLLYNGLVISEHLKTGYEFDAKFWRQLHELYSFAEKCQLQLKVVSDPLNNVPLNGQLHRSSCHVIYVKTLLFCHARPAELTRSQVLLLDDWLTEWSHTIPVECSYTLSKGDAQPLALDMGSAQGLQPVALGSHNENKRYLAMVPLSKLLRVKTILLQQGRTPQQVALSGSSNARECIDLLTFLHQCWCEDSHTRFGARHPSSQRAQLCCKPDNIYAHLSGKPFRPPAQPAGANNMASGEAGFALETWQLEDESILGAKLMRVDTQGKRLSHSQLLGLRIGEKEDFMLGTTTWVSVKRTGQLCIGIRYLPGTALAVTLLLSDKDEGTLDKSAAGFLLQAVPALKSPPSLIIPRDWFRPERVLEILHLSGDKLQAKMGFSVERGTDYERVSFTLVI
jgi:hypothetical protein